MNFWQPRRVCFSRRQKGYTQSPRKKKKLRRKNFFKVFLCTRQIQVGQVLQRIFGKCFRCKYTKTKSLWKFHFFSQNDVLHMYKADLTTLPRFFHQKGSETFAQGTRTMKSFEKLEKKTLFSEKIVADTLEEVWTTAMNFFWHRAQKI